MSFSKIPAILMYVIVGITILIMALFYFGENLVDSVQYEEKLKGISSPSAESSEVDIMKDLQSADSLSVQPDSTVALTEMSGSSEPVGVSTSNLSFMEKLVFNKTDIAIYWVYILILLAVFSTVIFPIIYALSNPSNIIRSLLVLIGLAVMIGVSYFLASGATIEIPGYLGTDNANPTKLKIIDTGLIFMYFMLGLALLSILYAEVAKYFK